MSIFASMARRAWQSQSACPEDPPIAAKRSRQDEDRLMILKGKYAEIDRLLGDGAEEIEDDVMADGMIVSGPSHLCVVRPGKAKTCRDENAGTAAERPEITVVIGTSEHSKVPGLIERIIKIVNAAYSSVGKHKRLDRYDAIDRLRMGDAGIRANRVLHLAYIGEELVGCASSTYSTGWMEEGYGHWGLLAVDPAHQGSGAATALVLAAERRLAMDSEGVGMEYQYTCGDPFSERLLKWYEDRLGFYGGPRPTRVGSCSFRHCRKEIPEDVQQRGRKRRLQEIRLWLRSQIEEIEALEKEDEPEEGAKPGAANGPKAAAGAAGAAAALALGLGLGTASTMPDSSSDDDDEDETTEDTGESFHPPSRRQQGEATAMVLEEGSSDEDGNQEEEDSSDLD
mmetsp:Transcript_68315/g.142801  ORF Transcript_68315/g.142801 Transcript_68315/m.142801 type:complete len:397 (+) Transcript_68315:103-1293(+)